ncbi:type III-A CRISPR-associated protein Cas10/Csm1 [Nostoc sp. JL33]|uniref:type III-A CRISPR-associated protein Cas10/Csm1 n=1 Tax=Nostoc sp. JL33 TaxID=2815396 RepID=UPI0025E884B2|nr:type III-A CRISPR-associated protein Cas10/Csm1 [Nostoc sp. JL33]MBN3873712.1 type III-A CRISPR-associated protein Cas10/Csm1 [Nostoc sp. JL33]
MVASSEKVALQVVQQAIAALTKWADRNIELPFKFQVLDEKEQKAVDKAKHILGWKDNISVGILRLLFDKVNLSDESRTEKKEPNYHQLQEINNDNTEYPNIPYPLDLKSIEQQQQSFRQKIKDEALPTLNSNGENLSLLMLILEKFGSCLSFGESDVALVDIARSTAAVAVALLNNPTENISLIAGDLSGIQKFIYTISSDGALKSVRARSFYLELVTGEIIQHILEELELPRTNIIYAGGGNLYLLAVASKKTEEKVKKIQDNFNNWLRNKFQKKIFLALDYRDFSANDVASKEFSCHWNNVIYQLNKQKMRKFYKQINDLLTLRDSFGDRCRVCHRDDTTDLEQLNTEEDDSVLACPTCREMFQLGSQLFKTKAVVRSRCDDIPNKQYKLSVPGGFHYFLLEEVPKQQIQNDETLFLINNWNIKEYYSSNSVLLLLGNYGKESSENPGNFIRAHELAKKSTGIQRIGYLRMDVDNLGKIFAKGLGDNHTLPRLAGLSRQMSYFFKAYLNSLANNRATNLPKNAKYLTSESNSKASPRLNLLFIYAAGDDLFISGSWNDLVEFAFDVYQSFRAYTGHNPYITLSGGISINDVKYPLYQAANDSGESEKRAKANDRDSLDLFGEVFKWDEWLGKSNVSTVDIQVISKAKLYINKDEYMELFGILPFVHKLLNHPDLDYPESFIRNLLVTAEVQELALKEAKNGNKDDIKYFLHLPKLAYAMSRLPQKLRTHEDFAPIRRSFMSPYNAPYFRAIATWIELLTRKEA